MPVDKLLASRCPAHATLPTLIDHNIYVQAKKEEKYAHRY